MKLLLDLGALVVNGDLNPSSLEHPKLQYHKTNVSKWADLIALFKQAKTVNGRIDHAFANAGIGGRDPYLEEKLDANGELLEPNHKVIDVNLKAVINTSHLAFHYMRHQSPAGGSVVLTASASSFQRFLVTDYTTAKHGVLGTSSMMLIGTYKILTLSLQVSCEVLYRTSRRLVCPCA